MDRRQFMINSAALSAAAAAPIAAHAQETFPTRTIRVVVPFAPGGTTDVFARLFTQHFARFLGVPVVVDNKAGAGGLLGSAEVHRATADGYTLAFQSPTSGVTGPLTRRTLPFDPVKGFSHISILGVTPIVLAVSTQSGITSLRDLVAKARATPGGLSYATGGTGGGPHLSAELFRTRAGGFEAVHVPYKGAAPALQDLVSGRVAYMTDTFTPLLPMHKEGRIRIIAVFGDARAEVAPDVATAREDGFDVVTRIANYLCAPPDTPAARLEVLSQAARKVMALDEVKERLRAQAYVPVTDSTPASATRFIADEVALWGPVIRGAGIALE
jgi:tripartite-type tricarboxylate transporter receptor subunit TctC